MSRTLFMFALLCALAAPAPARSEIADYMILRLLYLHSSCGVLKLQRLDSAPHHRRFHAECRNTSAFPEGVRVLCTDPDDDRHCRIETEAREFDSLELMRPGGQ